MNELDSLLRAAGRMMLDSQSPKVFSKGHHADFVTEADIAVQSYLVDALQRAYPCGLHLSMECFPILHLVQYSDYEEDAEKVRKHSGD